MTRMANWFSRLRFLLSVALIASASIPLPAFSQATGQTNLPLLFDPREQLSKPDLSSLVRLRFLTTDDFPPFNFADQNGKLAGFNVDLSREICEVLEIADKCQIQTMAFAELQSALSSSQGDAIIAGTAVTGALRAQFAFSRPYMMLPARFVRNVKVQLTGQVNGALKDKNVAVVRGTVHEAMLKQFFPDVKPVAFDSRDALLDALKAGKADVAFTDALQASFWLSSPASAKCCAFFDGAYYSQAYLGEGMTIMLRQNDQMLTTAIDYALASLSRSGRLQEIYLRYFPNGL
ncbi:transporter substrate-binding domain-containing protein [Oryzifoliimicrobium ureilyticus]|uniref:transporter substrate-binding domain-containing protein n=1 Tax=Oryzifoliimicrobium ureilyticus TaxID=3113724 RepID=UPI003075FDF3